MAGVSALKKSGIQADRITGWDWVSGSIVREIEADHIGTNHHDCWALA